MSSRMIAGDQSVTNKLFVCTPISLHWSEPALYYGPALTFSINYQLLTIIIKPVHSYFLQGQNIALQICLTL